MAGHDTRKLRTRGALFHGSRRGVCGRSRQSLDLRGVGIDGMGYAKVNLNRSTAAGAQIVFSKHWSTSGAHMIEVGTGGYGLHQRRRLRREPMSTWAGSSRLAQLNRADRLRPLEIRPTTVKVVSHRRTLLV